MNFDCAADEVIWERPAPNSEGRVSAELELKLELDPKDARSLRRKRAVASQAHSQRELSVYYDTPSGKLRKSGLTLRVRSSAKGFVQTVKTAETGAGLFFRGEWETAVGSIEPHVQDLEGTPAGKIGLKKLRPIVRSEVERTIWRSGSAGDLLEFALDQGELQADGRKAPLCELEIELLEGDPAKAFAAARNLADEVQVRIGVLSKAERGFSLSEDLLSKPSKAPAVDLRQDMTVAQGFAAIAQSCLKHFRLNEPLIVQSRDAVALHQARVALRRLRSALSLFRPALIDAEFPQLREELRWFTGQLGEARNLDVLLQRDLPERLRRGIQRDRSKAYDSVKSALLSKRFRLLMIDIVRWISIGEWRSGDRAQRPLPDYGSRRLTRLWEKIAVHPSLREMDDEGRHDVRIEIKKLRYGLEFFQTLHSDFGREQKRFLRAVEAVQETLGDLNDIVTARELAIRGLPHVSDPAHEPTLIHRADRRFKRLKKLGRYW